MTPPKGFTLVEVLVVVGVIALLAAIAIPNLLRAKVSANESSAQAILKTIATALENYSLANTTYPANTTLLTTATPPYLMVDYFSGIHHGYSFNSVLSDYSYAVSAAPITANAGNASFTITTGGVLAPL